MLLKPVFRIMEAKEPCDVTGKAPCIIEYGGWFMIHVGHPLDYRLRLTSSTDSASQNLGITDVASSERLIRILFRAHRCCVWYGQQDANATGAVNRAQKPYANISVL